MEWSGPAIRAGLDKKKVTEVLEGDKRSYVKGHRRS